MRPIRFRLMTLVAIVVLIAVALGGLRASTPFWAEVFESATLVILAAAALRTIALRSSSRIYWAGFLTAGGIYLAVSWNPPTAMRIITDRYLDILGETTGWSKEREITNNNNPF